MEEQATDAKDDNQQQKPTKIVENSQQEQLPETDQDPTSTEINDTNNSIQQRDESKNDDKQIENNDEQFENNDKQIENGDKQIAEQSIDKINEDLEQQSPINEDQSQEQKVEQKQEIENVELPQTENEKQNDQETSEYQERVEEGSPNDEVSTISSEKQVDGKEMNNDTILNQDNQEEGTKIEEPIEDANKEEKQEQMNNDQVVKQGNKNRRIMIQRQSRIIRKRVQILRLQIKKKNKNRRIMIQRQSRIIQKKVRKLKSQLRMQIKKKNKKQMNSDIEVKQDTKLDISEDITSTNQLSREQSLPLMNMPSFRRRSTRPHSALTGTFVTKKGRKMTSDEIHESCQRLSLAFGAELLRVNSTPVLGEKWKSVKLLQQDDLDEMVDRLYSSKPDRTPPTPLPGVTLKIKHDQNGRPEEVWLPIKKVTKEEKTTAMITLYDKCHEEKIKKEKVLAEKWLQPLHNLKKIEPKDKAQHLEKIEKLFKGQGVSS
eukprot:TRINITY_DN205_c1_g1_i9.p1 TRINITY_DN205_c1_g1~~TRINITY_DN205_c1_g1_i9.p1  ORF type:complete len:488 (+),score=67.51 TRINITY_DN205_c1_g1_i9:137-1600(+)